MNNVWSYPIAGIPTPSSTYETFESYGSQSYVGTKEFFGYTSEMSGSCEIKKAISIIHYTNPDSCEVNSEQIYGQKLYIEIDEGETATLKIPTLMWHYDTDDEIGHIFSGTGTEKYVKQYGSDTDIRYFDLGDENGNNVGRIFPDQHIFAIHDDELVAALSYKSNRNWTLPKLTTGLKTSGDGILFDGYDLHVTYLLHNGSSGYTTGLHCQYHTCMKFNDETECPECPDGSTKDVEVTFPLSRLPFMKTSGGTGWYADTFYILAQRVPEGTLPDPGSWVLMDFTSDIVGHTGGKIDPLDLEATTFVITKSKYNGGTPYVLHNFINVPETSESSILQFGDENFFYGNVCASGITNKYRTKFNFTVPPTQWNTTNNPTWGYYDSSSGTYINDSGQNPHISEVMIYDTSGNVVASGKMNLPIEKTNSTTIILEVAIDV
jgi:hypothetical protein